jgi:ribonucleoside-triphosphate reductase (thioredoxin)
MHMSDAVLSGGVRRSATICLFSPDDNEMLNAKTGSWLQENPQRARSNNSVLLNKKEITREHFSKIMESVKGFGEPGFVFTEDNEIMYNPCVEIGMYPQIDGISGFQGCNLCEINGGACSDEETFYAACKAAAIIGTLQAGYTDFRYVDEISKRIFEREALLGCSITGFMSNPDILLDPEIQRKGAKIIVEINEIVAKLIGINPAARTTCVKPSGNASVLLQTASGIHGEEAPMYFRNIQVNKDEDLGKFVFEHVPEMVEDSVWSSSNTDWVISFPIRTNNKSLFKEDLYGTELLEYVKLTQQNWVEAGTVVERCTIPSVRHNVSNTIVVDNWQRVEDYIFENRQWFAGISLLPMTGANDYAQAPFTAVYEPSDIIDKYGDAALFASGLIVDGLAAFNDNLWKACDTVLGYGEKLEYSEEEVKTIINNTKSSVIWGNLGFKNGTLVTLTNLDIKPEVEEYKRYLDSKLPSTIHNYVLKKDWIRRAKQFADRYFPNKKEMTYCLKDVYNYHKWVEIEREIHKLDFTKFNQKPQYVDIDSTGAIACSGVSCEITF